MSERNQALAAFYAARQRGNSGVYGGPQLPAAPPPPAPPKPAAGQGSRFEAMLAEQQAKQPIKKEEGGGGYGGLFGGVTQGLGKVLGAVDGAMSVVGNVVPAINEEMAKLLPDPLEVINPWMLMVDEDRSRQDERSVLDKITDKSYGYGDNTYKTGSKWADRIIGFGGDVAMDPITYLGGAATKAASHTIGKAGRTYMASTLARAGFGDDVVGEASRRGVAYLDDAIKNADGVGARTAAGVGAPGLYFGIGKNSKRIPGTERVGRALEKGFANARVNTVSRINAPVGAKLRTVPELVEARRVLDAGRAIDGVTPTMAAERIRFYDDVNRVMKTFTELKGRDVHELLKGVDARAAVAMTHALESGDASAAPFRQVLQDIFGELQDRGVVLGDLGTDYVPHRWTKDGWRFLTEDPRGRFLAQELKINLTEDPTAIKRRLIRGGESIKLPDGSVFKVPDSGTVKDINEAFVAQFGVKALEDDVRMLLSGYITEAGRALGLREAWQGLANSKSDIMQRLDAIGIEQLDELASITANKEMRGLIEKTIEARGRKLGERAASAADLTEKLRKSVLADLERTVKGLGDDHKNLQGELKDLLKQVKQADTNEAAIVKDFQAMYSKAAKEFDRVVKELQTATERVDALRGEQALADSLRRDASRQLGSTNDRSYLLTPPEGGVGGVGWDTADGYIRQHPEPIVSGPRDSSGSSWSGGNMVRLETAPQRAVREAEIAEARLADQMDLAVDALERLDDLGEQLFAASAEMRKWDAIADSPELLAEVAATRSVPEQTTRFVPDLEPALGVGGSMRMKRMDALYDQAVGDEAAEFERATRAAARSQEIVEAKGRRIEVLKGRLARVQAQISEEERALRVAGVGWVPLEMRARRARLLDRMAKTSDELREAFRKDRLALNRQERLSARSQEAVRVEGGVPKTQAVEKIVPTDRIGPNGKPILERVVEFPPTIDGKPAPVVGTIGGVRRPADDFADADAELWAMKADAVNGPADGGLPLHAQRAAQAALPDLEARYYELGTIKMELEQDLRDIADKYMDDLGADTRRKPFADARAAKEADLAETMAAIRRVEEEIVAAEEAPNAAQIAMIKRLDAYKNDTINEIANSLQTKKWHERLSKIENQPAFVNSPEIINAQRELVRKIERATDNYHVTKYTGGPGNLTLSGRLVTEVGERRAARTPVDIIEETTRLRDQLDGLPQAQPNPLLNVEIRGQKVSDEEAQVIADHLRLLSNASKQVDAEYKQVENELASRFPTANQAARRPGGRVPTQTVTDQGIPVGSQTLSKWEYDQLAKGAEPTVGGRRSGSGQRGLQEVNDADELYTKSGEIAELDAKQMNKADGFADDTVDVAEGDAGVGDWDAQVAAAQYIDNRELSGEMLLRQKKQDLNRRRKEVRQQYNNALRAYGLDDTAGDGFAYGRWGNILLVDMSGQGAPGRWAQKNTNSAIALTDKELEQAVRDAGKWPKSGRRPGHKEMAALIGAKAKLFKPDELQYQNLPEGLAEMVERSAARSQIERMSVKGRQAVLADARSAERFRLQPLMDQRRALEEQIRRNAEELGEIETVAREMVGNRNAAAAQVAGLQSQADLAGRVAASGQSAANDAMNARRAADQAVQAEGVRGVQAGGEIQARNEAVAGATADAARLEQKAEALIEIENTLGKREAAAVQALTVDRAISGLKAANVQSKAWSTAARKERVQKIADKVPKKIKTNKPTAKMVTKQLDDLKAVLDDAVAEGTPESLVTAELLAQATEATVKMNSEVAFQGALKDMAARAQKANRVLRDPNATDAQKLKAAQDSPAGVVMKMVHDGFEQIETAVFPEGADYVVKSEMNRMLKQFETSLRGSEPDWLRYYDEANKFFKTWATSTPGFHVRNFMSATFMNMSEGVGVSTSSKTFSKWREYAKASKVDGGAEEWMKELRNSDPKMADAFEAVYGSGTGGSFEFAELGSELARGTAGALKNNVVTRKSRQIGVDWTEGPVRLALAKHYIDKGGDVYSAMNAITRVHFDYSQVSNFDKQMKRIIPFWTFMSRNLPLQFEQMLARPKAYAIYGHLMNNLSVDEEGEGMPQWLSEVGGVTVARDVGWLGGKDAVLRPDMPFSRLGQEISNVFPNPTRLAASASPWLRVPFELGMNHSAFYNDQLFYEGEGGVKDQAMYAANNVLPPVATLQRLAGLGDYEGKAFEKQLNYVGLPVTGVSDEQRRRALEAAAR